MMEVMVELYNGTIQTLANEMWISGYKPMVLFRNDKKGNKIKVGTIRRVYTELFPCGHGYGRDDNAGV
jgi:hypothetical protein